MTYNSTRNKASFNFIMAYFSSSNTTIHREPYMEPCKEPLNAVQSMWYT